MTFDLTNSVDGNHEYYKLSSFSRRSSILKLFGCVSTRFLLLFFKLREGGGGGGTDFLGLNTHTSVCIIHLQASHSGSQFLICLS